MPLHLLGKKSWNVYNVANIERVKRDEAAAKAREEEEDRRLQDADTRNRLEQLRGQAPRPTPFVKASDEGSTKLQDERIQGRQLKRRRLNGEDDTDRDIRLAKQSNETFISQAIRLREPENTSIVDSKGNIKLFEPKVTDTEAESRKKRQKREAEDQVTMRFSNAAGFKETLDAPWYSSATAVPPKGLEGKEEGKDVWGKDDPNRVNRAKSRITSNDPLAFMKKGVQTLRKVEKERKTWKAERMKDFEDQSTVVPTKHHRRHHRHHRGYRTHESEPRSRQGTPRDSRTDDEHHRRRDREPHLLDHYKSRSKRRQDDDA